jgi:hypothetical protein
LADGRGVTGGTPLRCVPDYELGQFVVRYAAQWSSAMRHSGFASEPHYERVVGLVVRYWTGTQALTLSKMTW